jgi:hypothetical protein
MAISARAGGQDGGEGGRGKGGQRAGLDRQESRVYSGTFDLVQLSLHDQLSGLDPY